jgi:hypothetical protein
MKKKSSKNETKGKVKALPENKSILKDSDFEKISGGVEMSGSFNHRMGE